MSTDVVDSRTPLGERLQAFFAAKTSCDVDGTMAYFAPHSLTYIDATLGWVFDSHAALRSVFEQYMPNWGPPARSYATRILADGDSALVHMVDTPELFGGELRILAAIELDADGLVTSITSVYDSRQLDATVKAALVAAGTPDHDTTN